MKCLHCGSDRVYRFEPSPSARARASRDKFPAVCRRCGSLMLEGQVTKPPTREQLPADLTDSRAKEAKQELLDDPDRRIEDYLKNYYRTAFLDGFFRAFAFFRHESKEGRLARLRELWSQLPDEKAYAEMEQLLFLGSKSEPEDAGSSDQGSAVCKSSS